ncbi:hypothetical protein ACFQFC_22910 [Amorphoplanes digitatis]|uniref:hypothetical protein n=1 Tax=Actinoplanes digitatis TaxID=1868 RepID=UPI003620ED1F
MIATAAASGALVAGSPGGKPIPMPAPLHSSFQVDPPVTPSVPPEPYHNTKPPPNPVIRPEPTGSPGRALPPDPPLPSSCKVEGLPIGTAKSADVTAGDPTGRILVGRTEPVARGELDVLVWRDGKLIDRVKQRGDPGTMTDVNRSGIAVGGRSGEFPSALWYQEGMVRRLGGYDYGTAIAINDAGMIAGTYEFNGQTRPQRWSSPTAYRPEVMPLINGHTGGRAWDIDEAGTTLVTLDGGPAHEQTYLWFADGSIQKITTPPSLDPAKRQTFKAGAFHFGWVYGEMAFSDSATGLTIGRQTYRYEPASGTWQAVYDPAGTGQVPTPTDVLDLARSEASVVIGRTAYALPPGSTKKADVLLNVVSEDGRVVAGATGGQPNQATVWHCT